MSFKKVLISFLITANMMFALSVDIIDAESVALELLNRRNVENKEQYAISDYFVREGSNGESLFYVITFDPIGFVIVSADNRSKPVLGYSFDNLYENENIPPHYDYWLGYYADKIEYIIVEDLDQTEQRRSEWQDYLYPNPNQNQVRDVVIGPLITANWDQGNPYNGMCPGAPPTLVGCVAVSMAQIMYYWKYPDAAIGGYQSYNDYQGTFSGVVSTTFGTPYNWNNMENSGAGEDTQRLLFEAGVSVHMDYDYDGSGSYVSNGSIDAQNALKEHFDYENPSGGGYPVFSNQYQSTETWINVLKAELDNGRPMIYRGCSDSGCHAWNTDGYDEDMYFHMNMGWGGSYNGYYALDNLSIGGDDYDQSLGVLRSIFPADLSTPNLDLVEVNYSESVGSGDNDNVINPGETGNLYVTLENIMPWPAGNEINLILESNDPMIQIVSDYVYVDNIDSESTYQVPAPFILYVSENADITEYPLTLYVTADGGYEKTFEIDFSVSIDQENFPLNISAEIKGIPTVVDYDLDGDLDVFVGDYAGIVHHYHADGTEDSSGVFPYDMENQIWGSVATDDIDNDGYADIIVTSKSKHLVAFNRNGLQFDYDAESWLMGTPAIGQLDSDPELEIVVGGYSSSGKNIYAVNHDGTDVSGFPVEVGEKMIVGVALHDFNNNGKDDIVFGTDSDNIHLMYDNGVIAWTYTTGDKIQSAPSIINTGNTILICAGSKDDNMYCLNENGQLAFSVETDGNVFTSPSAVSTDGGVNIFFGSDDGYIYGVDQYGNSISGWPKDTGASVVGSVAFSDLDGDDIPEVVSTNGDGTIFAYHLDGSSVAYFPISGDFSYSASPQILDLDGDGDLELFAGTTLGLEVFDIKTQGSNEGYWSTHRGSQSRTGYIEFSSSCAAADVNNDSIVDILDIVATINFVMGIVSPTDSQECAADVNSDGIIDILDIVTMANIVMGS